MTPTRRLTLEIGGWYGWTMWPGYHGGPYHCPVRVDGLIGHGGGQRRFTLHFLNPGYVAGVQAMTYELLTLRREARYMLAAVVDSDRSVAIEPLDPAWMKHHLPLHYRPEQFDGGRPVDRQLVKLAGSSY